MLKLSIASTRCVNYKIYKMPAAYECACARVCVA